MIRWQLPAELERTQRGALLEIAAMQHWVVKTDANYFMFTLNHPPNKVMCGISPVKADYLEEERQKELGCLDGSEHNFQLQSV